MNSPTAVCSACGGDVVHVGTYSSGSGEPMALANIEVGFCLACGEALRLVERAGAVVAEPVLVPPPT
jgi:3-hydroxyisobutyrate dehydrogenase-like beta-hydroxyacid dehydrogenase